MFGNRDTDVIDLAERDYSCQGYNGGNYSNMSYCNMRQFRYGYDPAPVSNFSYNNDKLKINANVSPGQMACLGIGALAGVLLGAYLYKKFKEED